jgi:gamma-glutamylcyclotransferase (GGCT)/AIG2-like uncharacterized protein YtfP
MHVVFAYGSNMDLDDVARWAAEHGQDPPVVHQQAVGILHDHALAWNYVSRARGGGAANLGFRPGSRVAGLVYWVSAETRSLFDKKEGHPGRYRRTPGTIDLGEGAFIEAGVYRVTERLEQKEVILPRVDYLELIVRAARASGLPEWHNCSLEKLLNDLKQIPESTIMSSPE